jgi:hypothetical protein
MNYVSVVGGPCSSVGVVTDYGLDGPGSNPGGDETFRPSRPVLEPTQLPVKWVFHVCSESYETENIRS